jgi:hypothetical protein
MPTPREWPPKKYTDRVPPECLNATDTHNCVFVVRFRPTVFSQNTLLSSDDSMGHRMRTNAVRSYSHPMHDWFIGWNLPVIG